MSIPEYNKDYIRSYIGSIYWSPLRQTTPMSSMSAEAGHGVGKYVFHNPWFKYTSPTVVLDRAHWGSGLGLLTAEDET